MYNLYYIYYIYMCVCESTSGKKNRLFLKSISTWYFHSFIAIQIYLQSLIFYNFKPIIQSNDN